MENSVFVTDVYAYVGLGILVVLTLLLFLMPRKPVKMSELESTNEVPKKPKVTRKFYVHKRTGKIVEVVESNLSKFTQVYVSPHKAVNYIDGLPEHFYRLFEELV